MAFPVKLKVNCVVESLFITAVKPAGTLETTTFPSATKLSELAPVKVVPVRVIVTEFPMEPLLPRLSVKVEVE